MSCMSDDDLAETLGRVESPVLEFKREFKDREAYPIDTSDDALLLRALATEVLRRIDAREVNLDSRSGD
jgi:hypothetical protein